MKQPSNRKRVFNVLTFLLISAILAGIFVSKFFNVTPDNIEDPDVMMKLNLFVSIFNILILVMFNFKTLKQHFSELPEKGHFKMVIKYVGLMYLFSVIVGLIMNQFSSAQTSENQATIEQMSTQFPLQIAFIATFGAAISEEIVFRMSLMTINENKWKIPLFIFSSVIFALIHVNVQNVEDLLFLPQYLVLGLMLGISYLKTKNIFTPMFVHFIYNASQVILLFLISL